MVELVLGEGLDLLVREVEANPDSYLARRELTRALIGAWVVGFEPERTEIHSLALDLVNEHPQAVSCDEASLAYQQAIITGQREKASAFARYLREKGYWEPGFIRFCLAHGECGAYAMGLL